MDDRAMPYDPGTEEILMRVNIGEFMTRRGLITPQREGLVCEGVRRTYGELNERANRFANAMLGLGVGHGDRVAILALNEPEYYDMLFGLGKIGAILVPVNYRLAGPEIRVRAARRGESYEAIDHRLYELDEHMCVIADTERAVALGGVMGGADTEVTEQTTDVLIEAAWSSTSGEG